MSTLAQQAFDNAIATGYLSKNPSDEHYAGNFMFMGRKQEGDEVSELVDSFKHIMTREYSHVAVQS